MTTQTPTLSRQQQEAIDTVLAHPHREKLAKITWEIGRQLEEQRARHAHAEDIERARSAYGITLEDAQTNFGNVLAILERGADDRAERAIVSAFMADGLLLQLRQQKASRATVSAVCFLGAHTGFGPLSALPVDVASADLASFYREVVAYARDLDQGKVPHASRAELLVAVGALSEAVERFSDDTELAQMVSRLAADLEDRVAARLVTTLAFEAPSTEAISVPSGGILQGKLAATPRSSWLTALQAVTGWALVRGLFVLISEHIFGFRRQVNVQLSRTGISIKGEVELMGRKLREIDVIYPLKGLSLVEREVRFPRLPVYLGLIALLSGTFFGLMAVSWGLQATTTRLFVYGVLFLLIGVGLDFALTVLFPAVRRRCRLTVFAVKGRPISVVGLDVGEADRLLVDLQKLLRSTAN